MKNKLKYGFFVLSFVMVVSLGFVLASSPNVRTSSKLIQANPIPICKDFWRLDGTNAPPTADWDMGGFGFDNVDHLNVGIEGSIQEQAMDIQGLRGINFNRSLVYALSMGGTPYLTMQKSKQFGNYITVFQGVDSFMPLNFNTDLGISARPWGQAYVRDSICLRDTEDTSTPEQFSSIRLTNGEIVITPNDPSCN